MVPSEESLLYLTILFTQDTAAKSSQPRNLRQFIENHVAALWRENSVSTIVVIYALMLCSRMNVILSLKYSY
jgi:hypothetical protein